MKAVPVRPRQMTPFGVLDHPLVSIFGHLAWVSWGTCHPRPVARIRDDRAGASFAGTTGISVRITSYIQYLYVHCVRKVVLLRQNGSFSRGSLLLQANPLDWYGACL